MIWVVMICGFILCACAINDSNRVHKAWERSLREEHIEQVDLRRRITAIEEYITQEAEKEKDSMDDDKKFSVLMWCYQMANITPDDLAERDRILARLEKLYDKYNGGKMRVREE